MKILKKILFTAYVVLFAVNALQAQIRIAKATPAQIAADKKFFQEAMKGKDFITEGLKKTPSGLLYRPAGPGSHKVAIAKKPAKFSKVKISYSLFTIEDYTSKRKIIKHPNFEKPEVVPFDKLPYGLQEAIKMMNIGEEYLFYMPAKLAKNKYGDFAGGRALSGMVDLVAALP